jgi:hypothetical protein
MLLFGELVDVEMSLNPDPKEEHERARLLSEYKFQIVSDKGIQIQFRDIPDSG